LETKRSRCVYISHVAGEWQAIDPNESFELLLDLFVDGLAKRASSESSHDIGAKRQAARPSRRRKS